MRCATRRRGRRYRRLGFTVGARNRHPWGTHNHIVQFPGVFIELLTVGRSGADPAARPRAISFGAFNRDFLARGEGLSMLVLEGKGAAADAEAFRSAGIGDFDVFDFEREASGRTARPSRSRSRSPSRPTQGARYRLLHLPAALSGEFLESGVPEPCRTASPVSPAWCSSPTTRPTITCFLKAFSGSQRPEIDLERHHDRDAARRNPGDGPGRVPRSILRPIRRT